MGGLDHYRANGVARVLVNLTALRMGEAEEATRRFADEVLAEL